MKKIIGIGKTGGIIADQFNSYPEYRVYKVSSPPSEDVATLSVPLCADMEEYEKNFDEQEAAVYLRSITPDDEVMVVVEGGDPLGGILLRLLLLVRKSHLNVLYISPDRQLISSIQQRDDKITFGVLQEYARSGVFERIFLIHRPVIEELMGDAPLDKHEESMAYFLSYTVAMRNYFLNTTALTAQGGGIPRHARISTFGGAVLEVESGLSMFYPLEGVGDIHLFYGIPKSDIADDASLMKQIKAHVKSVRTDDTAVSYSIHATTLDKPLIIGEFYTTHVQTPTQK
jgi:hypothetical protein